MGKVIAVSSEIPAPTSNPQHLRTAKKGTESPPNPIPFLSRSIPHQTSRWANYDEDTKLRVSLNLDPPSPHIYCARITKNMLFTSVFRINYINSTGMSSKVPIIYRLTIVSYPQEIISKKEVSVFLMLNCISQTQPKVLLSLYMPALSLAQAVLVLSVVTIYSELQLL